MTVTQTSEFEVQLWDNDIAEGGTQFYAYPTRAAAVSDAGTNNGTGKITLVESQPVTTDANGMATVHHGSTTAVEHIYVRAVGSPVVVGVRAVQPRLSDAYGAVVPVAADHVLFGDISSSFATSRTELSGLVAAVAKALHDGSPATPAVADSMLYYVDASDTLACATIAQLTALFGAPAVVSNITGGIKIVIGTWTLSITTAAASGGSDNDVWIQIPA